MSLKHFLMASFIFSSVSAHGLNLENIYAVNQCTVHEMETGARVHHFPGLFCQFFEDGSFISADHDGIRFFLKDNSVKWVLNEPVHHQVNLSHDRKRILTLGVAPVPAGGKWKGQEKLLVLSLEGKILHEVTSMELIKNIRSEDLYSKTDPTHFNSIYEIPPLEVSNPPFYLRAGNIIANSYRAGTFILDPQLSKVLHHFKFTQSTFHYTHDVQVLSNGNYLFVNNQDARGTIDNPFSSIQEVDHQGKTVFDFTASPRSAFFSLHSGGVQVLDSDHLLISHMVAGTYLLSRSKKEFIKNFYQTHFRSHPNRFIPSQEVKAFNLKAFLESRKN